MSLHTQQLQLHVGVIGPFMWGAHQPEIKNTTTMQPHLFVGCRPSGFCSQLRWPWPRARPVPGESNFESDFREVESCQASVFFKAQIESGEA
eukprot:2653190-Rhodomonas_salina.1